MFGLIKSIFGNSERSNKIVDAVINGGDSLFFTDQEKKEFEAKRVEVFLDYVKATSAPNLARRFLAMTITAVWALYSVSYLLIALAHLFVDDFDRLDRALHHLSEGYSWVSGGFLAVITFYLGKGMLENYQNNKNK